MSDTSVHSKKSETTESTAMKPSDSNAEDLQLTAERLSLICGHLSKMPSMVVSGVRIMNGFLLVALKIEGHDLNLVSGVWMIDGRPVDNFTPLTGTDKP